jgi:hypothetical protein
LESPKCPTDLPNLVAAIKKGYGLVQLPIGEVLDVAFQAQKLLNNFYLHDIESSGEGHQEAKPDNQPFEQNRLMGFVSEFGRLLVHKHTNLINDLGDRLSPRCNSESMPPRMRFMDCMVAD